MRVKGLRTLLRLDFFPFSSRPRGTYVERKIEIWPVQNAQVWKKTVENGRNVFVEGRYALKSLVGGYPRTTNA